MKSKYIIYQIKWSDSETYAGLYTPHLKVVKKFRHESEAIAYISSPQNSGLILERHDPDGMKYEWNDGSKNWEVIDEYPD